MAEMSETRIKNASFDAVKRSHVFLAARTLGMSCYSRTASKQMLDIPSLSFTEAGVHLFAKKVEGTSKQSQQKLDMQFASKISRSVGVSPCSLMLALIYIERIRSKEPDYLRHVSSCDVFIVTLMIASKFLFDDGEEEEVFNEEWAHGSNIDIKTLNKLEREFLCAIDWDVFVDPAMFFDIFSLIEVMAVQNDCRKRSWKGLNYDELILLLDFHNLNTDWKSHIVHCFVKIFVLCTATYVAVIVCVAVSMVTISTYQHLLVSQSFTVQQLTTNSSHLNEKTVIQSYCQRFFTIESKVDFSLTKAYLLTQVSGLKCSQNFIL